MICRKCLRIIFREWRQSHRCGHSQGRTSGGSHDAHLHAISQCCILVLGDCGEDVAERAFGRNDLWAVDAQ
ncbi:hypothetical protein RT95_07065 [Xanthomonas campestris]|nr:hypothetical protein RT95_07065 [Xanthomonas campestris]